MKDNMTATQRESVSYSDEEVLHTPQTFRMYASPSDEI